MLLSWGVGQMLRKRFAEYSQTPMPMTGAQVAEEMLRQNGILDVEVISVPGQLTDHYNPMKRTVNLSESVYGVPSVAAAAVAAHECGHAVQHARGYAWLKFRSALVPVVSISSRMAQIVLMIGLFIAIGSQNTTVLLIGIVLFSMAVLFSIVTLPVEFDASKRALAWLSQSRLAGAVEQKQAKNALFWAAMTYVAGALAALGQLLYFVFIFLQLRGNSRQ